MSTCVRGMTPVPPRKGAETRSAYRLCSSAVAERGGEGVVEQLGGAVELRLGRAHRRHEAKHAALAALAENEAALEAVAVHGLAERMGRPSRVAVLDKLDPEQQATAADIADRLVALRQGF